MDNEYREVLSPSEERFERARKKAGLFLGPLVFLAVYFFKPAALSPQAGTLAAIFGLMLVFWLTEAVPLAVTAIAGAVLNVLLGVAPAKDVLAPFAHPIVFLFIGSFIMAEALTFHGLDKRFALAVFSIGFFQKGPLRVLFAIGAVSACISMWISNTAAAAMMLPIGLGILDTMKRAGGGKDGFDMKGFSIAMMLMVAYGASVGGIATPIGTPPNLIGIGMIQELTGVRISFLEWVVFALPITVVMFVYLFFILGLKKSFLTLDLGPIAEYVSETKGALGGWKRGEVNTALCFGVAVFLWVLPSIAELFMGKQAPVVRLLISRLNEGVVAALAAALLFVLPVSFKKGEYTISWERAARIDWGTILLFGGGLSLGELMFSTGLAEYLGSHLIGITGAERLWTITAVGIAFSIILSETTSNTASANMAIPVMAAVAVGAGVSPIPPALGACLGASFGFMLPVSTPPNAIVYGSGLVPILSMVKKGIIFDIGGFVIIMSGLMILAPLMGWA